MNAQWWEDAVIYQIYLRSFADSNGDGIGDLPGVTQRLDYLRGLGVDGIWLNPCYSSPQRDHGYDISDYFSIDPAYGTTSDLERLVAEAHKRGMRVLMDMVANHCSDQHEWFQAALAAGPGSAERERFLFRDGKGMQGELAPNNWQSVFGGSAWTRVPDGQWYFHAFDSGQPDFNWRNREVVEYFDDVIRFWFDRGVDGFRIDVAHGLFKQETLEDWPGAETGTGGHNYSMWDQPEVHDVYRRWRAIGDQYPGGKYFVGEIWVPSLESMTRYISDGEMHQAFSFDLLVQPWDAQRMAGAIDRALEQARFIGSPPAWTLSNHDVHRTATRYGQVQELSHPDATDMIAAARRTGQVDLSLGVRRARAAIMLQLALPGTTYLYQGEELGLPEVFDLPDEAREDPIWLRSNGAELGRDGCRVPLPWTTHGESFGFSGGDAVAAPWLPQPEWFSDFAADAQGATSTSTLALYENLIAQRSEFFDPTAELEWLDVEHPELLAFRRGRALCAVNFSDSDVVLPGGFDASGPDAFGSATVGENTILPANSAVWLAAGRVPVNSWHPHTDRIPEDSPLHPSNTIITTY